MKNKSVLPKKRCTFLNLEVFHKIDSTPQLCQIIWKYNLWELVNVLHEAFAGGTKCWVQHNHIIREHYLLKLSCRIRLKSLGGGGWIEVLQMYTFATEILARILPASSNNYGQFKLYLRAHCFSVFPLQNHRRQKVGKSGFREPPKKIEKTTENGPNCTCGGSIKVYLYDTVSSHTHHNTGLRDGVVGVGRRHHLMEVHWYNLLHVRTI